MSGAGERDPPPLRLTRHLSRCLSRRDMRILTAPTVIFLARFRAPPGDDETCALARLSLARK
jgi:hypothetical protein